MIAMVSFLSSYLISMLDHVIQKVLMWIFSTLLIFERIL